MTSVSHSAPHLLSNDEPPSHRVIKATKARPFLLTCDHASNRVPAALCGLGLSEDKFARHYAYDIGAERVTELMAERLGVGAVIQNYSRMVIDCNRYQDQPSLIPEVSDGLTIPGNQSLSLAARQQRIDEIYIPYHNAIAAMADGLEADIAAPIAIIGIHSFTPCLENNGTPRPWHIGILWRKDQKSAEKLISHLRKHADLVVGDNEPYSMLRDRSYTVNFHAEDKKRCGFLIEMRQNEVATAEGQDRYASLLAEFFDSYSP